MNPQTFVKLYEFMGDRKKNTVMLSSQAAIFAVVSWLVVNIQNEGKALMSRLDSIERHTIQINANSKLIEENRKAIDDNRKAVDEVRDTLKRNSIMRFEGMETGSIVFAP